MVAPLPNIPGYTLTSVAGRGGMGVVYVAKRDRDGERVALKVMTSLGGIDDSETARRFEREMQIAQGLSHPSIVPILGAESATDGTPAYLVMRYVEGEDLQALIRREGPLQPDRVLRIVRSVASALDHAHAQGLVHRDIKPANVLLDVNGSVYLTDFGLAREVDGTRATATGMWMGTLDYAAPEQIENTRVDARTDLYALGCLGYHALTGTVPFPGASDAAKLYAHVHASRPTLPREITHAQQMDAVLQRAMAISPADRYVAAGDLAEALRGAAEGATVRLREQTVARGDAAPNSEATRTMLGGNAASGHQTVRSSTSAGRGRTRLMVGAASIGVVAVALVAVFALKPDSDRRPRASSQAITDSRASAKSSGPAVPPATSAAAVPATEAVADATASRPDDLPIVLDDKTTVPTRIGSWNPIKRPTFRAAAESLGDRWRILGNQDQLDSCPVRWAQLGITVNFVNLGGRSACGADDGFAQTVTIDNATDRWRTRSGLRIGMPEASIRRIYPKATRTDDGVWTIVREKNSYDKGETFIRLAAVVDNGAVSGFEIYVGGAGE